MLDSIPTWLLNVSIILGLYQILKATASFSTLIWKLYIRPLTHSKTRQADLYNGGPQGQSWAVVTGGSDGIGLAMCKNLAL